MHNTYLPLCSERRGRQKDISGQLKMKIYKLRRDAKHVMCMTEQAGDANCHSVCWQGPLKLLGKSQQALCKESQNTHIASALSVDLG